MTIVRPYGDTAGPKGWPSQRQRYRTAEQVTSHLTASPNATGMKEIS